MRTVSNANYRPVHYELVMLRGIITYFNLINHPRDQPATNIKCHPGHV